MLTVEFLPEWIGSVKQDVGFGVDRLQLLQSRLPPTDALNTYTHMNPILIPSTWSDGDDVESGSRLTSH